MAETLADFLSRKMNDDDPGTNIQGGQNGSGVESGVDNSAAAPAVYGNRENLPERASLTGQDNEDLSTESKNILNAYASELTSQNANTPGIRQTREDGVKIFVGKRIIRGGIFPEKGKVVDRSTGQVFGNNTTESGYDSTGKKDLWPERAGIAREDTGATPFIDAKSRYRDTNPPEFETDPVEHEVVNALMTSNRFNPSSQSPYITTGEDGKTVLSRGMYSFQNSVTKGNAITGQDSYGSRYNPDAPKITLDMMRKIADDMLLAQSRHLDQPLKKLGFPSSDGDFLSLKEGLDFSATAVETGIGALPPYVDVKDLEAGTSRAAINMAAIGSEEDPTGLDEETGLRTRTSRLDFELSQIPIDDIEQSHFLPGNHRSHGAMNNPYNHFSGVFPSGMIWPTIYMIIGLIATSVFLEFVFGFLMEDEEDEPPTTYSKKRLGSSQPDRNGFLEFLYAAMGYTPGRFNFGSNLGEGIKAFINFDGDLKGITGEQLAEFLLDIIRSPGYYLVILKNALTDLAQVDKALSNFSPFSTGLNDAISDILGLFDSLFSSRFFRFLITLESLGDIRNIAKKEPGGIAHGILPTREDLKKIGFSGATRNQHLSRYRGKSPLSLHLFPSAYLAGQHISDFSRSRALPGIITANDEGYEEIVSAIDSSDPDSLVFSFYENNLSGGKLRRIPAKIVKMMEDKMEQEYMPFYFHDLRTNEIVGLPAFISTLNESYSIEYNDTKGLGRTDAVKTYTGTARSIDLTFKIIAMNALDHELMWKSINRLIAMLYPQRSQGRMRRTRGAGAQFIVPFSQVPTASPLIRLRLGELLHSNMSIQSFSAMMGNPGVMQETKASPKTSMAQSLQEGASRSAIPSKIKIANQAALTTIIAHAATLEEDEVTVPFPAILLPGSKVCMFAMEKPSGAFSLPTILGGDDELPSPRYYTVDRKIHGTARLINTTDLKWKGGKGKRVMLLFQPGNSFLEDKKYAVNDKPLSVRLFQKKMQAVKGKDLTMVMSEDLKMANIMPAFRKLSNIPDIEKVIRRDAINKYYPDISNDLASEKAIKAEAFKQSVTRRSPSYRAFVSTRGRGLAGFITNFSISYDSSTWEISKGSRGPKSVEISMNFAPIHDMTPGLDHDGRVFAPTHPMGNTSYSDPYDEKFNMFGVTPEEKADPPEPPKTGMKKGVGSEGDKTKKTGGDDSR